MVGARIPSHAIVDAIAADRATLSGMLAPMYARLPQPSYALPMAWSCAVAMSNQVVDAVPRYSSADHGTLFRSLLAVVRQIAEAAGSQFAGPHFDAALEHD